jgi:serine/threonine-protein kinase HipA
MKRFQQFSNSPHINEDMERLFILVALNAGIRNGDAHLKNFGIVYDDVLGEGRLAPSMTSLRPPSTCPRTAWPLP